jgi:uncharacterized membrane protein YqjE
MQFEKSDAQKNLGYGAILREIASSAHDLLRGELLLAKAELKDGSKKLGANFLRAMLAASFLFASLVPLTAFFVLSLGDLIDSYVASSAIVFALYFSAAGFLFSRLVKKMRDEEAPFTGFRQAMEQNEKLMQENMIKIQEAAEWRKAV